jgi:hypothetical protein
MIRICGVPDKMREGLNLKDSPTKSFHKVVFDVFFPKLGRTLNQHPCEWIWVMKCSPVALSRSVE